MLAWLLPPAVLLVSTFDTRLAALLPAAVLATALSAVFWMLISHGMGIPAWYGLAYPLGALMTLYIILRSTWRGGRRVEWRGRTYGTKA
jgi:polyferredoxin